MTILEYRTSNTIFQYIINIVEYGKIFKTYEIIKHVVNIVECRRI